MPLHDPTTTLHRLIERNAAGDPLARDLLIRHCQERLKSLTRRMLRQYPGVRRWEETSDVFQNVLVRLDRAVREVVPQSPAHYLSLAAAHIRWELIDLARHHRASAVAGGSAGSDDPPDTGTGPSERVAEQELHARIAALPDAERALFDLVVYHGLTQPEAATALGLPLRTFKRRWQAARLGLMRQLGGDVPL